MEPSVAPITCYPVLVAPNPLAFSACNCICLFCWSGQYRLPGVLSRLLGFLAVICGLLGVISWLLGGIKAFLRVSSRFLG